MRMSLGFIGLGLLVASCAQPPKTVPASEAPAIVQAAANVPKECAAFLGGWEGKSAWPGLPPRRLWVTEVDSSCAVKYAWDPQGKPTAFSTARVDAGQLVIDCGGLPCNLKRHESGGLTVSVSGGGLAATSTVFYSLEIAK